MVQRVFYCLIYKNECVVNSIFTHTKITTRTKYIVLLMTKEPCRQPFFSENNFTKLTFLVFYLKKYKIINWWRISPEQSGWKVSILPRLIFKTSSFPGYWRIYSPRLIYEVALYTSIYGTKCVFPKNSNNVNCKILYLIVILMRVDSVLANMSCLSIS